MVTRQKLCLSRESEITHAPRLSAAVLCCPVLKFAQTHLHIHSQHTNQDIKTQMITPSTIHSHLAHITLACTQPLQRRVSRLPPVFLNRKKTPLAGRCILLYPVTVFLKIPTGMGHSVRGSHNRGSSRHVSHLSAAHRSLFCYAEPAGPAPPRHVCAAEPATVRPCTPGGRRVLAYLLFAVYLLT